MDMNNYSYSPTMLSDDNNAFIYRNDDIEITIDRERHYSNYVFWFYAYSFDGVLELSACFKDAAPALEVAAFIKNHFAHTQPDDNNKLQQIVDDYSKSLLNVTYSFNNFYNMNA